jgi:hypothetical protein
MVIGSEPEIGVKLGRIGDILLDGFPIDIMFIEAAKDEVRTEDIEGVWP